MPEHQLFLPFEAPQIKPVRAGRPVERDRLFFAVLASRDIAAAAAERLRLLRVQYGLKGRPIASARLHVSLFGLGDYFRLADAPVLLAREAGNFVVMPAFEIAFDRVLTFVGRDPKRPLVLRPSGDAAALVALHHSLGQAMKEAGLGRWAAPRFTPHMTLLYDDRVVKEEAIEPIRIRVSDFALVHSLVGQSRYVELARWPLRG
jgi:2'-5' RNA ligase